jgi:flagellar hook assembly protein FlgD
MRATAPGADGTAALSAGFSFNMVGALLPPDRPRGLRARLTVRVSANGVAWGPWQALVLVPAASRAATAGRAGDKASEPLWIGAARHLQYRLTRGGRAATPLAAAHLRFVFINTLDGSSPETLPAAMTELAALTVPAIAATPLSASALSATTTFVADSTWAAASSSVAATPVTGSALAAGAADSRPAIVTRAGWGADESWRRGSPQYAGVRMAFIHHTAGTTEYTPEQAPAIVRAVYYYHTKVLGWSDIGYNFLIDRYGTIYQGRRGSMQRGVIGAQTLGFNAHSTGISLMGTFDAAQPTPEMLASLERLLAWKLSLTGVDPAGHATMGSSGSGKFAPGARARFKAVSAHQDACFTDCPGAALYARMTQVRLTAAALAQREPLPLFVSAYAAPQTITPNGDGLDEATTISLYAYSAATVRAAVYDESGAEVRLLNDWTPVAMGIWGVTWDGTLPADGGPETRSGTYTVRIDATDAYAHTATAEAEVVVNATVSGVSVKPAWFSPNGDGAGDKTIIAFTLDKAATPVVTIGPASAPIRSFSPGPLGAGSYQLTWDGLSDTADAAPDGRYPVTIHATDDTGAATVVRSVAIDRIVPQPVATAPWLTVSTNARLDVPYLVRDSSADTVRARVVVTDASGTVVRDSDRGWVSTGRLHAIAFGSPAPGVYYLTVTAYDHAGNRENAPAIIGVTVK